ELGDIRQPQQHFLAWRQVANARLKYIRPLLVEQVRTVAPVHRIVVHPEGVLAFLDLADNERAVDDRLESADGSSLVERKHVDGFDRLRLAIDVALRDGDARAEARDLGLDRHAR